MFLKFLISTSLADISLPLPTQDTGIDTLEWTAQQPDALHLIPFPLNQSAAQETVVWEVVSALRLPLSPRKDRKRICRTSPQAGKDGNHLRRIASGVPVHSDASRGKTAFHIH